MVRGLRGTLAALDRTMEWVRAVVPERMLQMVMKRSISQLQEYSYRASNLRARLLGEDQELDEEGRLQLEIDAKDVPLFMAVVKQFVGEVIAMYGGFTGPGRYIGELRWDENEE